MTALDHWRNRVSASTWEMYEIAWRRFTEEFLASTPYAGYSPERLLELDVKQASMLAEDFYRWVEKQGFSPATCSGYYQAIRSFYSAHYKRLGRKPRTFKKHATYESDRLLTKEEIWKMIQSTTGLTWAITRRNRAAVAFWAQSMQRVGIICAMRIGHLVAWRPADGNYVQAALNALSHPPVVISVQPILKNSKDKNVNKAQVKYSFGLADDACRYVKEMLEQRIKDGEALNKNTPLFRSYSRQKRYNGKANQIETETLNMIVRDAAQQAGIQEVTETALGKPRYEVHAHINRRYGKNQMREGGITDRMFLDYMLGHQLPYGGAYDRFHHKVADAYRTARDQLNFVPKPKVEDEAAVMTKIKLMLGDVPVEKQAEALTHYLNELPVEMRRAVRVKPEIEKILKMKRNSWEI